MKEFLKSNFQNIQQVVRYGVVGITGAVIQVVFLYFFVDIFEIWYLYGVVLAFLVALVVVFPLQKFWTFKDYSLDRIYHQSALYTSVVFASLVANVSLMYLLVDILNLWYILAQSVVVLGLGVISFLVNKHITFSSNTPSV